MKTLLQIDFPFDGPFGNEMTDAMKGLAESIAQEPGLIWKVWTENADNREAGGIYLFEDEASARAYLDMHSARLKEFGVPEVNAKVFAVNEALSAIDNGPV
ncbi:MULTISPECIES: monooxygenase [Marinobacter]|uniref:Putative mono-oxygenase ydhR n=1 Tax=Marinobacter segnicrescens TaxID=430453 RepID=A0A1I0GUF6_9GAMM|nr:MULTISPECIES: monooxygenase [Marinobacter]UZD66759.1 monooxygenase [Marinobacter sp. AN1]SET73925.1 Putative mono-oxygenase ydhR [Marinobacter segnicrescens]